MIKLYIGGLSRTLDEMGLARMIFPYGEVQTMKIVRDRATRQSKGYAFIEVKDEPTAFQIMEGLNGTMVGDLVLDVKLAPENPAPPARKPFRKPGGFTPNYDRPERGPSADDPRERRPRLRK